MLKPLLRVAAAWFSVTAALFASGGGGGCAGGGGAGFCGFGGSDYPFELPKVEEDVSVGGLVLKLDRTKWGYSLFARESERHLARFVGDDIEVTLRRIPTPPDQGHGLVETLSARNDVLYARTVTTSGALRSVKVAYGVRRNFASREQTAVRYFVPVPGRGWLCFEARPAGKAPQWADANDLILGARLDRSKVES